MRFYVFSFAFALAVGCGGAVRTTEVDGGTTASAATSGAGTTGGGGSVGAGGAGGGSIDVGACGSADRCMVAINGCCPRCDPPDLADFAAINAHYINEFRAATCPVPMACPRCLAYPNSYIGARCVNARCETFDVRQIAAYSACTINADCRLRKGLECCECGSKGDWTAISIKGEDALRAAVCSSNTPCDLCGSVLPPDTIAAACASGHCEVIILL